MIQLVVSEQSQRSKNLYGTKNAVPHEPPVSCHVEASVWHRAQSVRRPTRWRGLLEGCWRMACSGNVLCIQFIRSPLRTIAKSGARPVSQTGCPCAATSRAQYQMSAGCNMHRFQCRHQAGHRFRGADLCTRASRGHTVSTKRLARGKQCRKLRYSCANSDAADAQLAKLVWIV